MKLKRGQRQGLALVCYNAFHVVSSTGIGVRRDRGFMDALTPKELEELEKLKHITKLLADRWRGFAWKLEGWDSKVGPPRKTRT